MNKVFLFVALIALTTCFGFHHGRHGFRRRLQRLRHFTQEEFEKFQSALLSDEKPSNRETHWQAEIAKKVNRLRTTWQATEYKRDYKPLLGAILDGLEQLPEKEFKQQLKALPTNYDPRDAYPKC